LTRFRRWLGLHVRRLGEFFNRRWLDYAGLSGEEASDWGWTVALHPEDRVRLTDYWQDLLASGEAGEIEAATTPFRRRISLVSLSCQSFAGRIGKSR